MACRLRGTRILIDLASNGLHKIPCGTTTRSDSCACQVRHRFHPVLLLIGIELTHRLIAFHLLDSRVGTTNRPDLAFLLKI